MTAPLERVLGAFLADPAAPRYGYDLGALGPNDNYAYAYANAFNYSQVPLGPARMVQRPLPASAKHIHLTEQQLNDPT